MEAPERLQIQVWPGQPTVAYVRADLGKSLGKPKDVVRVSVNEKEFWVKPGGYTGMKIRYDLGISIHHNLYWKAINSDGSQTIPDMLIEGEDEIWIANGMEFYTVPRSVSTG